MVVFESLRNRSSRFGDRPRPSDRLLRVVDHTTVGVDPFTRGVLALVVDEEVLIISKRDPPTRFGVGDDLCIVRVTPEVADAGGRRDRDPSDRSERGANPRRDLVVAENPHASVSAPSSLSGSGSLDRWERSRRPAIATSRASRQRVSSSGWLS